jgi:FkbM family methyltransferase
LLKRALLKPLAAAAKRITNNQAGQSLLGGMVDAAQYLQGIGAGSDVRSSGETAIFDKLLERADTANSLCVFDIGANQGQFLSLACRCLAGRAVSVHCFEPGRETYLRLCGNAPRISNVILNNCGLGRKAGECELYYDACGSGLASLTKRNLEHFGVRMNLSERVRISTVDDYCAERAIEGIDLLKIDVEGHELDVLHGAARMFERRAIGLVTFEFGGCNIDTRAFFQDFYRFFQERGMRMARIAPGGYLWEIASYRESLEQFRTTNFICYRG